tara:strand:+ start:1928 stop:5164 length:3237 start_codon:yes stop_codon:yes gene_type:complete
MNETSRDNILRQRKRLTQPPDIQFQRPLFPSSVIQRISKIDNLRTIQIQNFKSIINETLELRTGTFLSGFNSAGKSSFTHALLLILQWLESLTSGQPGKVPINGPLIQLGTSAENILNRTVQSRNSEKSPSTITLTWNENDEFIQVIVFKLSTNQSSSADLQLEEVSITHKANKQKAREKEWKYKYQNKIITNDQRTVGWYVHRKLYSNPYLFEEESIKVINQLEKLNKIEVELKEKELDFKNPYLVIKDMRGDTHRRKYLFHPSEVNITENQPALPSGFENNDENTDSSLVSREDLFKFLIFKKFCEILLDTPVELDQEFSISQMLYQLRNKKISTPEELGKGFVIKDLFNFDIKKNFLDDLQYRLENLEIIDLESELSDSINNDIKSYVVDKKLLNEEEFIPDNKEAYIDSINFAELLNLYNITAHKPDKTSQRIELEKQIKENQRRLSGRFFERYSSLREFQADELLKHLDINNKKEHKSINEGDAFADELVDLLSSDLNFVRIVETASGNIITDEELRESEISKTLLAGNFSRAIRSYLFGSGDTEGVFEIYEKQQAITNLLPKKVESAYINFQDNFINSTNSLDDEIDELLNLHEQTKENEISNFNEIIEKFKNEIFDVKEEMFILDAKRESLIRETLKKNDDTNINKNIRKNINDLNKDLESKFKDLENLEIEKNRALDKLNKLTKEGISTEDTNFSYFLSDQEKLDKLIDQKAVNLFKEILNSCESNINKIETYTLLKLLIPNFLDNDILKEYQQAITSNLQILEVDNSTSIEDLLETGKFIILPKEKDSNFDDVRDFPGFFNYSSRRGDGFTFFSGNSFYSDFNFLSATRNVSNLNSGRYYGGNNISPLGSSSEFLTNYLNIHKNDKFVSPLPQSYLDGLDQKGLSDNALYELPLSQHLDIWSSFIFGNEMKIDIDETSGLNLMVGEDTVENVGSGVNQVLPIITQLIISNGKMLLLEEVEQNLHPEAQANLADMIITFAKRGRKILVETHSDHLINRLRLRIVENTEKEKDIDISIYFTNIDEKNGTNLIKMDINENGEFITDKIPEGFFDQPQKDTIQILKALKKKKT